MRVLKALLVFALLIQLGASAQTATCGKYPLYRSGTAYASEYVFPWFAAEGDSESADIATSPGWKSWIAITNLSRNEGVSVELMFQQSGGGGYGQPVWISSRGGTPKGVTATQFGMYPGETAEVRVLAKAADMFAPTTGLAIGSVTVIFTSQDPCDLDMQGKVSLLFGQVKADGTMTRLGSVDPVRLSAATNLAFASVSVTPAWARPGNLAVEVTSFALMNLSALSQDIRVSLLGSDGSPAIAPKTVTLEAGAVIGIEVENFFGIDAFNTTSKTFTGRVVFEGSAPLAAIALQFVGNEAMGSKKVWSF